MKLQTVKFSLSNRIYVPTLFPVKGDFETAIVIRDLQKKLQITQDEIVFHNIRTMTDVSENKTIAWDSPLVVEIEFTDLEIAFLKQLLIQKNEQKELQFDFDTLNLYSQIVFNKELE
jgi:hypothetical protein